MHRPILTLLILTVAVLVWIPPTSAAKRVALVVGIDAYDNLPTLQKAVNDERAVAAALSGLGFDVIAGENLTRRDMNEKLTELDAKIEPGDTVFFYFAGHGVALGAENYLILRDLPKPKDGEENLVRDEGHSVDVLVRRVQERGAGVSFFVLDACRDNPLAASGVRSIGGTRGLTRAEAQKGVFMLFSAGIGQTALDRLSDDDPDPNSVFTRKLVPLLQTPGMTDVVLAKRVQQEVDQLAATVHHDQQPAYYDQIIGEVELGGRSIAVEPKAAPKPVQPLQKQAALPPELPAEALAQTSNLTGNYKAVLGGSGEGELVIRTNPDGSQRFTTEVFFENGHSCQVSGTAVPIDLGWRFMDGSQCILQLRSDGNGKITFATEANAECRDYCGAGGALDGVSFRRVKQ